MTTLQEAEDVCGISETCGYSFDHAHNAIQLTDHHHPYPIISPQGPALDIETNYELGKEALTKSKEAAELQARIDYLNHCPTCPLFLMCNPEVTVELGRENIYPVIETKLDDPDWDAQP